MAELKEIAEKAAEMLPSAFAWSITPQGHNYWAQIYIDLIALAEIQGCDGYGLSDTMNDWERSPAPLCDEGDRKLALELADLIDELLLHFLVPVLGPNDPFDRWSAVQADLFELGGEYVHGDDDAYFDAYFDELENG